MSEHQVYEFKALDGSLSAKDKEYVRGLSSRAKVSSTSAYFVYNYGDFRGEPEEVLDRCFDVMVYFANYGVRTVMVRLPKDVISERSLQPYTIDYFIKTSTTEKSVILALNIISEDYYVWIEDDESWIDELCEVRNEILQGDLRSLYLSWLKAGLADDAPPLDELMEPPIPPNLKTLSPTLTSLTKFFKIDMDMVAIAAESSPSKQTKTEPIADWIAALSEGDRNAYLLRVAQGDTHVGADLMQHLRKEFGSPIETSGITTGRTLAEIITLVHTREEERNQQEQAAAEARYAREENRKKQQKVATTQSRQLYLQSLVPKVDRLWTDVFRLIGYGKAKSYDEAVEILKDLRDVATMQGQPERFGDRIDHLMSKYSSRSALLRRIRDANLHP